MEAHTFTSASMSLSAQNFSETADAHAAESPVGGRGEGGGYENAMEAAERAGAREEGERGREDTGKDNTVSKELPQPSKLQRFYFESDTLALKNNPE